MTETKTNNLVTNKDKQVQPMPDEIDPRNAKVGAFLAMKKAKSKLDRKK